MNFQKVFTVTRQLERNNIPLDLIQLTLEFVGDLNETVDDLVNKHVFSRIEESIYEHDIAFYCHACNTILFYKTNKGLSRHIESVAHKHNAKSPNKQTNDASIIDELSYNYCWMINDVEKKKLFKVMPYVFQRQIISS